MQPFWDAAVTPTLMMRTMVGPELSIPASSCLFGNTKGKKRRRASYWDLSEKQGSCEGLCRNRVCRKDDSGRNPKKALPYDQGNHGTLATKPKKTLGEE